MGAPPFPTSHRSSAACTNCRRKRQRCDGDRSGCSQCTSAMMLCTWPEQRKRGPEKGYVDGLECRLFEVESILLHTLPFVSEKQLELIISRLLSSSTSNANSYDSPKRRILLPGHLEQRQGLSYWAEFPLGSVAEVRNWQRDCESRTSHQLLRHESISSVALQRALSTDMRYLWPDGANKFALSRADDSTYSSSRSDSSSPSQPPTADHPGRCYTNDDLFPPTLGSPPQPSLGCKRRYTVGSYFRQHLDVPSGSITDNVGAHATEWASITATALGSNSQVLLGSLGSQMDFEHPI